MQAKYLMAAAALAAWGVSTHAATPPDGNQLLQQADRTAADPVTSPVLRIDRGPTPPPESEPPAGFRRLDGRENNLQRTQMGAAGTLLRRWVAADYADGLSVPASGQRLGAREISNIMAAQSGDVLNTQAASDMLWQWGQFLDHDIDLTDGADPAEPWPIAIPAGDPWFDPAGSGEEEMALNRSLYDPATGINSPRQQTNEITAWIDASNVYGSDQERAIALRLNDGSGRLKTSAGNLLPFNEAGLSNAGGSSSALFLAGDVRANEQVGLTVLHTLFVREHNRLAAQIAVDSPRLTGEEIYQRARRLVGALMQAVTYKEYLPALLGAGAIPAYAGYDQNQDAAIANLFSAASYRYGHSAFSPTLLRLNADGTTIAQGNLSLRDAFFSPSAISSVGGIEPYLRGLAGQRCQAIDPFVVDDVRNFLFGNPGEGGFDLASLNIQRGRDHGLPDYNRVRAALGLSRRNGLDQVSGNPQIRAHLAEAYSSVDDMDLWIGGLAEDPQPGAMVGELIRSVLVRQFTALRDGDRFWYQRTLEPAELDLVENSSLADIIRSNTTIGNEIPDDVFHVSAAPRPR